MPPRENTGASDVHGSSLAGVVQAGF